ncbi:MAG TPA: hypothetical protein VN377_03955, partial [Candidatus Thermoplasmatota archaeon]|nr:hypothetical protein [Candidatus Thermoplasmatota archaeon]
KAGLVMCIAALFIGTSAAAIGSTPEKLILTSTPKTATLYSPTREEVELKYYMEEGLSQVIGIGGGTGPYVWKTAIRLTQDEMAAYTDWTLTKVNVAFSMDNGLTNPMDIKIYIYDKGTTSTRPGAVIVSDTTASLDTTGITTVPLVTPVDLSGHEELWVAIEWTQIENDNVWYAWLDTVTGPHVPQKGDFIYLNNAWSEIYTGGVAYDGNWGIGAIVEGAGLAELSIGNIKGPMGIKADVSNIGANDATNVQWSIAVTGGLLKRVNVSNPGTVAALAAGTSTPISLPAFIGFGKISIVITAKAQNANEVSATKSAFLLGLFVIGIK